MKSAAGSCLKRRQLGVTLIELCVVMAVVAILYAQAAPAFSAWVQNAQIRTAAESIQSGLQLARSEAIRRNRSVIFWLTSTANPAAADWLVGCANPSGAGTQPESVGDCPGTAVSAAGPPAVDGVNFNWIQRQAASDQQTANAQVLVRNGGTWVTFNSLGFVIPNADGSASINEIDISNPQVPTALARTLEVLVSGGQIRMCDPKLSLASDPRGCT
jgi:type IV fimbrial biogenesis protein FimT